MEKINCKVIATYYGPRRRCDAHGVIDAMKMMIDFERKLDSGCLNDTIIVNHENDFNLPHKDEFYNLLKDIDGTPTKNGVFKVIHRPFQNGIGGGFASFNYAFEQFKYQYEYWFFAEDNKIVIAENVFKNCIERLEKEPNLRFIGCIGKRRDYHVKNKRFPNQRLHIHGGYGCVHISSLLEVYDKYKRLPYSDMPMSETMIEKIKTSDYKFDDPEGENWYKHFVKNGEIEFTNVYTQFGYELGLLKYDKPVVEYVYIMNNQRMTELEKKER